jgi:hypothetical protein
MWATELLECLCPFLGEVVDRTALGVGDRVVGVFVPVLGRSIRSYHSWGRRPSCWSACAPFWVKYSIIPLLGWATGLLECLCRSLGKVFDRTTLGVGDRVVGVLVPLSGRSIRSYRSWGRRLDPYSTTVFGLAVCRVSKQSYQLLG